MTLSEKSATRAFAGASFLAVTRGNGGFTMISTAGPAQPARHVFVHLSSLRVLKKPSHNKQ
jgi:hypothetical protein